MPSLQKWPADCTGESSCYWRKVEHRLTSEQRPGGTRNQPTRIHIGSYAYELSLVRDEETGTFRGWEYRIFRTEPTEELLCIGTPLVSRETAERQATQLVTVYKENEKLKTA